MKENYQKAESARGPAAAAAYYLLSALLFPVSLAGYAIWVGRALRTGRGSGVSGTAQGPLSARCFEHPLGTREDGPTSRLMTALPNVPA